MMNINIDIKIEKEDNGGFRVTTKNRQFTAWAWTKEIAIENLKKKIQNC